MVSRRQGGAARARRARARPGQAGGHHQVRHQRASRVARAQDRLHHRIARDPRDRLRLRAARCRRSKRARVADGGGGGEEEGEAKEKPKPKPKPSGLGASRRSSRRRADAAQERAGPRDGRRRRRAVDTGLTMGNSSAPGHRRRAERSGAGEAERPRRPSRDATARPEGEGARRRPRRQSGRGQLHRGAVEAGAAAAAERHRVHAGGARQRRRGAPGPAASPSVPTARCSTCEVQSSVGRGARRGRDRGGQDVDLQAGHALRQGDGGRRLHAGAPVRAGRLTLRYAASSLAVVLLLAGPLLRRTCRRRGAGDEARAAAARDQGAEAGALRRGGVSAREEGARASTASVLLAIEIGADGKVGNVARGAVGRRRLRRRRRRRGQAVRLRAGRGRRQAGAGEDRLPLRVRHQDRDRQARPAGQLRGRVLERFTKKPMAGVAVTLESGADRAHRRGRPLRVRRRAARRAQGAALGRPAGHGRHRGDAREGPEEDGEVLRRGRRQEGIDEETVVRAARIKKESVQTVIRTEEARRVPGTQGDTLKVVQNLPGVARSALGSGALIVWGSAPADTRVYVDGVEIPALYHVGGLRSTVNSRSGALDRSAARRLRRRVRPRPRRPGARRDARAAAEGRPRLRRRRRARRLGDADRDAVGRACASASPAATATSTASSPAVTSQDVGDFFPIPRYDDYQAMANLELRKDEQLTSSSSPRTITCAARSRRADPAAGALGERPTPASTAASCATRASCPTAPASWSRRRSATTPRPRPPSSARCRRPARPTPGATACAPPTGASWRDRVDALGRARPRSARVTSSRALGLARHPAARRRHLRLRPAARRRRQRRPLARPHRSTSRPTSSPRSRSGS